MRSVATGIESYYVDNNSYPLVENDMGFPKGLSTPIAYITSAGKDPFGKSAGYDIYNQSSNTWRTTEDYWYGSEEYFIFRNFGWYVYPGGHRSGNPAKWVLQSKGPDMCWAQSSYPGTLEVDEPFDWLYDPTNGTVSRGNIVIAGP